MSDPNKEGGEARQGGFPEEVESELRWTAWDLRVRVLPKASPAKSGHKSAVSPSGIFCGDLGFEMVVQEDARPVELWG